MDKFYYTVQFEQNGSIVNCETPQDVFNLLKNKKIITVSRYNDVKTGAEYTKVAAVQELAIEEQKQRPFYIKTILSDDGVFVPNEAFWIENYMFDEFYNPDRMPYIEKMIK